LLSDTVMIRKHLTMRIVAAAVSPLAVVVGCASAQPVAETPPGKAAATKPVIASTSAPTPERSASNPDEKAQCDLVCEGARVVSHEIKPEQTADYYTQKAVEHADRLLGAMHDDLLYCYTARLKRNPRAHGFITVDIVIGPTGNVQKVETLGGALLGDVAMNCIVERIKRETFDPPPRGGTMRLEVPFTLRQVAPDEPI
jgi:hypothetical protein